MKKVIAVNLAVIVLLGVLLSASALPEEKEWRIIDGVYGELDKIQSFGYIQVWLEGDSAEKLGLTESKLTGFARLRFKNNLAGMKYEDMSKKMLYLSTNHPERAKQVGYLRFQVWVVGDHYPIAYHVECEAGHFLNTEIWTHAVLGYCSKRHILDKVKECINDFIEKFAVTFFQVRGEI